MRPVLVDNHCLDGNLDNERENKQTYLLLVEVQDIAERILVGKHIRLVGAIFKCFLSCCY